MVTENEVLKVLRTIEEQQQSDSGFTWARRVAKQSRVHPETVRRIIDGYLFEALEFFDAEPLIGEGLRIRPFKLKDGITAKSHFRWLKAMGKL
jgi:hypothetical protein